MMVHREGIVLFIITAVIALTSIPSICMSQGLSYQYLVTFEKPDSKNKNYKDEDVAIVFPWEKYGRDDIPFAAHRVASFTESLMPQITDEWSRSGKYSIKCISKSDARGVARGMFQLVSNFEEGVSRNLVIGETYWIAFSIKNMEEKKVTPWELYFQLHDNTPPPQGWGKTRNPQVAIERENDEFYRVIYRYNTRDGKVVSKSIKLGAVNNEGYSDFVLRVKISNPGKLGELKVWQRNEGGDLINYVNLNNIRIGYYRENRNSGPAIAAGIYNGSPGVSNRVVYIDNFLVSYGYEASLDDLSSLDAWLTSYESGGSDQSGSN